MFRDGLTPVPPSWHFSEDLLQAWPLTSKGLSVSNVMIIVKSWVNAWCTTTRYHEAVQWPCIFGCDGADDSLCHYLNCPHLWSRVGAHAWTHVDPAIRLGLDRPTPLRLKLLVVASRCYHALKFGHRGVIEQAISDGNFSHVQSHLRILAETFRQELGVT